MSIISDSMLRNNDNDRASAQYASSQPYSQIYSDEGSSNDNQQGLLERIFNGLGAASDWISNNVEYVENSPVGQWIGNNVEYVENSPVGQALAPANSIFQNWPALLGLAAIASVTPQDNDTFSGSLYDAGVNGAANTVGSIADLMHKDDLAAAMYTLANKTQDNAPVQADWDWDYITNPHGLTRSFGNAIGSMAPLLPAATLAPESLVAAAGRLSPWLANGVRYGFTAIPEAMAEGGQTRREAIEEGLDHPDLRAFGTMAKNLPLLAVSNTLEGAILGGGLGNALAGKAGESILGRMAKAPFRATPSALAEGLQNGLEEGLQQGIQNASVDKEYGYLPWNWTDDQWDAAKEGFFGTLPLGGIGGARKAIFPGAGGVAAATENGPDNTDPVVVAQLTGKNDDVPTADGVDVTELDPQQYTQWYGDKLKAQGIDVPDATITVQTPKAQQTSGTGSNAKSGAPSYDASALEGAPQYTISDEVSSTDVTPLTDQKMRLLDSAYYNKYGQHLYITSMKRNGNPDESWHNSGQAFDTADDNLANNKEARDWLVSEGEKLGLTPLDEYENPSAHATGGHIHFSDHGDPIPEGATQNTQAQNTQETANNGNAPAADLSSLPVGDIATAIAQNTGLPANFIWAQLSHESDGGNSKLAREDHNYGGVKGNDGEYLHFDNDQQFVDYMSDYYPKYREDGIYDAQTADQFAEALQHGGYFTADLGEYEGGMHRYLEQAGLSDSGTAGTPSEKQSTVNTMTQQQFGDMLNEKMIDFAGTNDDTVKAVFNDMSTSKDKALVALFAPYMQDGAFANTAANREALVGNDGFKKAMSMFLSKHLSDYAPTFKNGRISFQQAEDALRPRHQQDAQATQTVQAPNIQTATTPQALIQMVQKGLNREQQGAILQAANTALHTPQGMANGDEAVWMNKLAKAIDEHDYPTIAQMIPNESMQALSAPKQGAPISMANTVMNPAGQTETEQAQFTQNAPANVVAMPAAQAPTNADTKNRVSSKVQGDAPVRQQATAERQAPQSEVASTVQSNTPVQQTATTENEMPHSKVASTVEANMPANQAPVRMDNQQAGQQDTPQKQDNVTPLPTQEAQQSEGVRIAQPQPTIDEQNAQMDARIAAIKKQPLAQRKALGQQYLDTLRQNNVSFSEKKLAKSLMNGDPEALEHVQRTYGDLLNTITPAEAAAASQQTTPRTVHAIRAARLNGMMNEIAKGSTFKNASTMQKLAYLMTANSHAGMLRDQGKLDTIHNTIDKVRADAGLPGSGLTDGMTKEQRDSLYYETIKQQLDDEAAIRKEATDEDSDSLRGIDNDIKLLMRELADSRQKVKAARKENTNESTQSESQRTQDEGAKNQDQHAKPEPRKAADTQREAEEGEVSDNKKAADEGGQAVATKKEQKADIKNLGSAKVPGGLSKEAQEVYIAVRDKLRTGKSERARRAADVSAEILARHADTYAKAYSKATGKKYTAADYMRDKIGIDTDGNIVNDEKAKQFFQKAWHGSPHDFDRFDLGAIGTGEGAQVHGWGLYFAANREVSEGYIERLSDVIGHEIAKDGSIVQKSDEEWVTIDNAPIDENTPPLVIALKLLREVRAKGNYNIGDAIQKLQWQYIQRIEDDIVASDFLTKWYKKFKYRNTLKNLKAAEQILKEGKYDFKNITSGHLFEVEIPEADTMLDEQLSYSEQPKMVQKAIDALYADRKKLAKEWKNLSAEDFKEIYHPSGEAWTYFMEWNRLRSLNWAFNAFTREDIGNFLRETSSKNHYPESKIREIENSEQAYNKARNDVRHALANTESYLSKMVERVGVSEDYHDMNGREIYQDYMNALMMYHNISRGWASKNTALALREHGVNGVSYVGGRDGRCYITFDDKTVKIINKYNQMLNGAAQGYTSALSDGKRVVTLLDGADESTFLHEMGHVFLLDLQDLAEIDQTSANDMSAVESWATWKTGQAKDYKGTAWEQEFADREKAIAKAMADGDEATASQLKDEWMQERFARGFERYLESGEAPSSKLKSVFEKFKQFLTRIYNAFKGAGGKPSEDVKNVMARMMDSDVENTIKVPAMGEPIHGIKGAETTVITDSGKEIRVRYRAVPASRVITSHDAETMVPNKSYPQELQPRDRQRVSMQEQVTTMANELRPADLGAGRNLNQGAPIIRKDGVVLNGNGRAMAIQKATAAGGDKATAYRKYIFEHSKEFGLSRSSLAQLRKYMLVREVVDDIDADTMQDIIGSTAGGSRMGASEQAKADAKKIKPRDLDSYVDNEQGDLTTAANQDFVARVLYRIVGKNERNAYTDEHGNVNADGIQRVKRALFSLAYNDDGLIDKMAESTDDNIRNVSRGLMSAAPAFARVNLAVKDGQAYEYDAEKTISDAVKHLDALRREGKPVKDYLNEQSMFSEYQDTDEVREVLRFFDENKRSGKKIGIFLNDMARSILEQGSPNQTSLMDGGRATLGEIIKSAERVARDGTTAASLFDNVQEAPAEEKTKKTTDEKKDESIFGSVEDADKEMLDALGLSEDDLTDDVLTAPSGIKNTAEERERLEKELSAELNKMSAMPMFNPKIYTLGLKLAMTYVKDGINTVKKLVAKLNAKFGDKIGPWAPALAETVRTWPKGVPFDEKKVMAISKAVGARYESGITSLDDMQADMKKLLKGQHDSFAPMIEASYNGIRKFFEAQKGENDHVDDSTSGLAERAGRGSDSDRVGPDDAGGESGRRSGRGVQETERAVQPEGGARVRDRSAAAGGEAGNRGIQAEESGDRAGSAGSAHVSRSVRDSYEGSVGHDADRNAADIKPAQNRRDNASPAGARARAVKPNKSHKQGDLGSIKNDLPMLKPEQQEDVEFIETRVNVNNKPGVMLTNGTGTGKTYSGLGFVKRMYDAGKKNILIVSPSESINDQWIEAASKHFDLSIEKLDSTKDSGKDGGICITTYANLQANKELVNRNWDAVVSDESHTLMQNEKGGETGYLSMLRALTLNPRGAYKRFKLQHRTKEIRSLENQIEEREKKAKAILRPYKDKKKVSSADKAKVDALQKEIESLNKEMEGIFWKMSPGTDKLMQDLKAAYPEEKRPKVLFLSATPFTHDKDIDYAEGYLFNYEEDAGRYGGYNQGTPSDRFMMKHFGYRMRYNKLTRPDAEVDSRAMEVQFHDDLVNSGAMHGRQIDVDKDYDRGFILVDGGIGHKIDEGFKFLSDNHAAYGELHQALLKQFNKSQQKYLIESIKAREVIPLIQEYVKKGKKVVLFHQSMVEHKNIHPFQLKPSDGLAENAAVWAQWKAFKSARPDLVNLSLGNIPAPMETLRKELGGHAVFINGSVLKKDRAKNIEQFNDDNSGVNIIVCQQDAANAGISLHDTTGKHPRVLINIAMPERPSYAMQIEGRIYRVGNASNAVFRYLSTGTDIEKNMFASTIGGRAASVENLAVGNAARGLRESFRDLYQETMDGSWKRRLPGAEGEGTGGKEMDYAVTADLSEYDRAKSFYFAHQKRTSRTKAQEGNDYFATPEPIGYKMVEWLGLKSGEKALEPSAGHGAISRWFPETTERTIVEPSGKLMPLAQMNTPGAKTVHGSFEDFNIVNKFDGIAMNPPYGTGGKTAIEHLQKAFKQLHDGGRVVAIIPEGPAADKRYSKMMEEISSEVVPIADIHLPAVAFSRAGTKVGTHIVVLDRYTGKAAHQAALDHFGGADDIDLRGIDSINDLFDRMENMAMPERYDASNVRKAEPAPTPAVQLDEARVEGVPDETPNFTADEYEHTKTHEVKFRARPKSFLGENYRPIQKLAKAHGGYYSKFAKNSFLFEDEDERNAFLQEAEALLSDGKASAKGSVAEMVKHIEFPAADTLTEREKAMQEFGQQMGVRVVFFDGPENLRGFYNKGITFINRSASKSPSWVFWHENLHWLRSNNPELYRQMVDYISGRQEFSPEQLQAYRDAIGRPELTDADTIEEMLADAMPDVHKRVDLFRKMGRENKSLIQRFFGWLRDTMAAFHNAFSQPKYGLSKTQAQAMRNALANIAEDLRDGDGHRIFRTRGADREILTAQGEELSYPVPDDSTKYSADKRDTEPAGSPGRMRRALVKLGLSTEQLKNVELRQAKGKQLDDISGWDMLAKSVRQVARKSPAVQYIYRLGRKALDEQEHLRNFYAQEIRKFNQYVKNPKILEEVAQLLWEGDATGHAYTGDELQAMGVSVEAGRAYNLVRRVLADAYKRVNEARMQVKVRTEVIGRNDYREFIASHFLKPEDVLKAEMLRNGSMRVTYRGAKVYSKNEEVVSPDVYNRLRKDKDVYIKYAEANEDGTYTIGYTERVKPIHNLEGYMPHFFHHFMVYEKTKGDDGKEILVSLGSANSLKKATDLANQYAKANPKGQFVIRPHSFEYDENYNNVVVGDKDYMKMMMQITKHTEMTLPEANAFLHDSVGVTKKGRHRFFGNAQHRKGAKGFDRDVQWALTHYLNASARYVAMEHFKPEAISFYERFFGDFNAEPKSNTARYIKNFINDMNGVPSYIEDELNKIVANIPFFGSRLNDAFEGRPALALSSSISWFNAVTKLGLGNFASAAINFMQFINIGTRLNSYAYANMGLKRALKPSDFDRRIIEESGVMDEVNLASDAGGYTQTRDYGRARKGLSKVKKGLDLAMIPFTKADSLMRKAAILGAYYQGVQEKGMKPEHEGDISRKAIEYAKDVNYDANFDYSTAAAPGAMRAGSVLTQQLFQFQKYPIMQFEFFWNNVVHAKNNKQRARFLVPYLLMSGAVGAVPFGALVNAVASSLVGAGGDDDNDLAEEIKAEMMKWAGTDPMKRRLVNTVLYGILANANINISERVGMSNAFSGEYYGNKPQSSAGALLQLFGGPLVSTVYNVATQIGNHNPIETIKAVSPSLGNMLQAVVGETRTTHHRVGTVYEDMYSRVMHALGFRSVDETNNSFVNSYLYKQQKQEQEDRKDAMDAYIRNPSSENHQRMVDLGIKDSTFKTYKENANKSSKERSQGEKKTKSKKPQTASQKEDERLKGFTK